jgi:hypothetical protein
MKEKSGARESFTAKYIYRERETEIKIHWISVDDVSFNLLCAEGFGVPVG